MAATAEKENKPFVTPPKDPTSEEFFRWRQMNDMIPDLKHYEKRGLKESKDFNKALKEELAETKQKLENCNEFKKFLETYYKGYYERSSEDYENYKFRTYMQDLEGSESQPEEIVPQSNVQKAKKKTSERKPLSDRTNKDEDRKSSASKQTSPLPRQGGGSKKRKRTKRNKRSKRTKKKSNKRSKKR